MISRRSIELQPWACVDAGAMISRRSKAMQSSEGVDDITKVESGAIFGGGRRYHKNQNRRNYCSESDRRTATERPSLRECRAGNSLPALCPLCGQKIRAPCGRLYCFQSVGQFLPVGPKF